MFVIYEGKDAAGNDVKAELPLIVALRGHEPILPNVLPDTVKASIVSTLSTN